MYKFKNSVPIWPIWDRKISNSGLELRNWRTRPRWMRMQMERVRTLETREELNSGGQKRAVKTTNRQMKWHLLFRCTGEKWSNAKSKWSWWPWWTVWWARIALRPRRSALFSRLLRRVVATQTLTTRTRTTWPTSNWWSSRRKTAKSARASRKSKFVLLGRKPGCGAQTLRRRRAQYALIISKNTRSSRSCPIARTSTTPSALTSGWRMRSGAQFAMSRFLIE